MLPDFSTRIDLHEHPILRPEGDQWLGLDPMTGNQFQLPFLREGREN